MSTRSPQERIPHDDHARRVRAGASEPADRTAAPTRPESSSPKPTSSGAAAIADPEASLGEHGPTRRDLRRCTIEEVSRWAERLRQHLRSTYVESTRALVAAVEAKDPHTRSHSLTVAAYAGGIGKRMRLHARSIETLRVASMLHDVGKIGVPDAILTKPGPLTEQEFSIVKRHPETALEILGHVSFLTDERPLILHHHERYDGTGYPGGLAADHIPIGARILAVADALDTMFSPRTYKKPYAIDHVETELRAGAGGQFDPAVTDTALTWLAEAPGDFPAARVTG